MGMGTRTTRMRYLKTNIIKVLAQLCITHVDTDT